MNIKPIETIYNGYRFRSRLEARWAVFFDAMKIKYRYETEGYVGIYGEKYLPDFYLPDINVFVEVKPNIEKLKKDSGKISACIDFGASELSDTGLLILGQIPFWNRKSNINLLIPHFSYLRWNKGVIADFAAFIPGAKKGQLLTYGASNDVSTAPDLPELGMPEDLYNMMSVQELSDEYLITLNYTELSDEKELHDCYLKARQARFEYGEKP